MQIAPPKQGKAMKWNSTEFGTFIFFLYSSAYLASRTSIVALTFDVTRNEWYGLIPLKNFFVFELLKMLSVYPQKDYFEEIGCPPKYVS